MFADGELVSQGVAADVLKTEGLASAKPGFVDRLILGGYVATGSTMLVRKSGGKTEARTGAVSVRKAQENNLAPFCRPEYAAIR